MIVSDIMEYPRTCTRRLDMDEVIEVSDWVLIYSEETGFHTDSVCTQQEPIKMPDEYVGLTPRLLRQRGILWGIYRTEPITEQQIRSHWAGVADIWDWVSPETEEPEITVETHMALSSPHPTRRSAVIIGLKQNDELRSGDLMTRNGKLWRIPAGGSGLTPHQSFIAEHRHTDFYREI